MTTLLNGLLGGLLIGLVAGTAIQMIDSDRSPTATILNRLTGRETTVSRWLDLTIKVLYGGLAGGLLMVLELYVLNVLAVPPTRVEALGVAVAWSAVLFVLWVIVFRVAFSRSSKSTLAPLFVYHLIYGIGLGFWIRLTWIT